MLSVYIQGMLLGLAMILPIGPQNAYVLAQGIRRQYHFMTAGLCAISDVILIGLGIFGGGALLSQSPILMQSVTWAGVTFLLWYGWNALKAAFRAGKPDSMDLTKGVIKTRYRVIASVLAVTWLNPHVYLDTVVVLGSLGEKFAYMRLWFFLGAVTASIVWFFTLALLAGWLAPWLQKDKPQRIINLLVGSVMWVIAIQLGWHAMQVLISA